MEDGLLSHDEALSRLYASERNNPPPTARPREAPIQTPDQPPTPSSVPGGVVGDQSILTDPAPDPIFPTRPPDALPAAPFELLPPSQKSTAEIRARINPFSYLLGRSNARDKVDVQGLDEDLTLELGKILWVAVSTSGTYTAAVGGDTNGWPGFPETGTYTGAGTEISPFIQTMAYRAIAICVDKTDGRPGKIFASGNGVNKVKVLALTNTHLRIVTTLDDGRVLITFAAAPAPAQ